MSSTVSPLKHAISIGVIDAPSMPSHITHNSTQITQKIGFFANEERRNSNEKKFKFSDNGSDI